MAEQHVHQGRNIKRFREMLGIKQEALAFDLGDDWSQKKISILESKQEVDDALLQQVAKILKVPADAIRNFSEEAAINIISSTFENCDYAFAQHNTFNVNPVEKWLEAMDKNEKLYERLLETEREKVALLEKQVASLEQKAKG